MLDGRYAAAVPVLERAVERVGGASTPLAAAANDALGETFLHLGRCQASLPLPRARGEPSSGEHRCGRPALVGPELRGAAAVSSCGAPRGSPQGESPQAREASSAAEASHAQASRRAEAPLRIRS